MDQRNQLASYHGAVKKHERKSKREVVVDRVIQTILDGVKILIIIRGMPGSGKSSLANRIYLETVAFENNNPLNHIFSADDYFCNFGTSPYCFDPTRLDEVHSKNQRRAMSAMRDGISPVIIDNTNITVWEFTPYVKVAMQFGYIIELVEPYTPWCLSERQLAQKNIHGIPMAKIKEIAKRYWNQGELFGLNIPYLCGFSYAPQCQPPQQRNFPPIYMTPPKRQPLEEKPPEIASNALDKNKQDQLLKAINAFSISPKELIELHDAATNTNSSDFAVAAGKTDQIPTDIKIISTTPREIHTDNSPRTTKPPAKLHLDKSSMTDSEMFFDYQKKIGCCVESKLFQELVDMFPNVNQEDLRHVFTQCGHNVNWAVDVLIDSIKTENFDEKSVEDQKIESGVNPCQWCQGQTEEKVEKSEDCDLEPVPTTCPSSGSSDIKSKKEPKNSVPNEELSKIKRIVEEQFVIGDEHYSEQCLKIKKLRFKGVPSEDVEPVQPEPTTDNSDDESYESFEDEELVEINVGVQCIQNLDKYFSGTENAYPNDLKPIITLPISLARQIYALWLESFQQQMSHIDSRIAQMITEDEEFAHRLQQKENELAGVGTAPPVPNLQEIMDMEIALAMAKGSKNEPPETLAMRLTKQNLAILFPEVSPQLIGSIYTAHNNNYADTVQVLMDSLSRPPIKPEEIIKRTEQLVEEAKTVTKTTVDGLNHGTDVKHQYYQKLADEELDLREKNLKKAREMYNKGSYVVATYYSDVANAHRQKYVKLNALASKALISEYNKQHDTTLDLHYFVVPDAVEALDMFIDKHVKLLQDGSRSWKTLYFITGRGLRSPNQKPKIKPAVLKRLKQRGLRYSLMNPGLVSVKIRKTTLMSTDF